jgi:APA family basic amino acid/polyamine antiporter
MARKLRGFERILDAPALFAVAYGELASSIYFALGIVALYALGLTPVVLLVTGLLFLVVSLSYAEGTAAIPEAGGATTVVRRAFNDVFGFATGWALLLDYLIVIALSTLFLPHYLGGALSLEGIGDEPWDVVVAVIVIAGIAAARLARHSRLHTSAIAIATLDLAAQLLLIVLGFGLLFSADALTSGIELGEAPTWGDLAFALPLAMLAYTGLETISNLAEETREPGRALPRSLFSAIGLVVLLTVLISLVGLSAFPEQNGETALGTDWLRAPILGIVSAFDGPLPAFVADLLRVVVGLTGAAVLLAAATTSMSGCTRLAYALAQHGQLPRVLGRLNRRTLASPAAIVGSAVVAAGLVVTSSAIADDVAFLASLYSFGVLLTFTAAQLAVLKLRVTEPDLPRPFRAPFDVTLRGARLPLPALVGAPLTFGVFVAAMITHSGARFAGPAWLVVGLAIYLVTRVRADVGLLEEVAPLRELPPGAAYRSILVPMKLGDIGEEMVATAIALAKERDAAIEALFVIRVPFELRLDADVVEVEEQAAASLAEAQLLGADYGVEVHGETVRARSIGHAIVEEAERLAADLVVLGSSPRWRRQSQFFSPTVQYVLRNAPCEVLVVAFPQGVLEEVR